MSVYLVKNTQRIVSDINKAEVRWVSNFFQFVEEKKILRTKNKSS